MRRENCHVRSSGGPLFFGRLGAPRFGPSLTFALDIPRAHISFPQGKERMSRSQESVNITPFLVSESNLVFNGHFEPSYKDINSDPNSPLLLFHNWQFLRLASLPLDLISIALSLALSIHNSRPFSEAIIKKKNFGLKEQGQAKLAQLGPVLNPSIIDIWR